MRVAYVSSSLSRTGGGMYYSVSGLAKAVAARGAEISVFGGADGFFEQDRHQWGEVSLVPHPLRDAYGFHWQVFGQLLSSKPDLLHVHGIWSATSICGRLAQLAGIPVVVSPHGMLDPWIVRRRRVVKAVHGRLFERSLVGRAHVHALNAAECAAVTDYAPDSRKRAFVLPNGISAPPRRRSSQPRTGVLYLGRLHPKKQVLELAEAWARSPRLRDIVLTIAGWGDRRYEAAVRSVAQTCGSVRFVGPLLGDAKTGAFESARAFILPSLSEGQPMAVLEALQHGCLPLITEQCNLPELFADRMALQIRTDLSDLESVVANATAVPDEELEQRSGALSAYARRYSWDAIAATMIERYREIIERHAHGETRR